ncbi:MAG: sugar ABC transporter permease [Phototrophicaceae bacterium]
MTIKNQVVTVQRNQASNNNMLSFWGFVGPMFIGLLIFTYIPIIWGFYLSLHEARNTVTPQEFVGFQNYIDLIQTPAFIDALQTGFLFALFIIPVTYAFSLGLALLVNDLPWGEGIFRTIFFIPTAVSYVIASVIWKMSLFNGLPSGFMNNILWYASGMSPVAWVNTVQPPLYWLVLVTVRLWLQAGFFMIILLAGLKEIPKSLYEAARVDGAEPGWQTFRYITFPLLRGTSVSVVLLIMIQAFQAFDEFRNILTANAANAGGGNAILARPPLVYLYSIAFSDQNYGRGSAGAFIVTLIIVLVTLFQARIFGFGGEDTD